MSDSPLNPDRSLLWTWRKRPVPTLPSCFQSRTRLLTPHRMYPASQLLEANTSFPVLTFPVSTLSCRALLICGELAQNVWTWDVVFVGSWQVCCLETGDGEGGAPLISCTGRRVCRKDLGRNKGGWPDVFIAAQWSRSAPLGVNQFLWGSFTLTSNPV